MSQIAIAQYESKDGGRAPVERSVTCVGSEILGIDDLHRIMLAILGKCNLQGGQVKKRDVCQISQNG